MKTLEQKIKESNVGFSRKLHDFEVAELVEIFKQHQQGKKFFLFGKQACQEYEEGGIKAVLENGEGYGVTSFKIGETAPSQLLAEYDGYMDWVLISEEEYNQL